MYAVIWNPVPPVLRFVFPDAEVLPASSPQLKRGSLPSHTSLLGAACNNDRSTWLYNSLAHSPQHKNLQDTHPNHWPVLRMHHNLINSFLHNPASFSSTTGVNPESTLQSTSCLRISISEFCSLGDPA